MPARSLVSHAHQLLMALIPFALSPVLSAQEKTTHTEEPTIVLSPFQVVANPNAERYSANEATSGGRIAVKLSDSTQSVAVVTRDLMDDSAALRILDAVQYGVAGITESTIPNGLDRTTIRGFQTDGQTVDGFYSVTQMNLDPVFIDRIEVVKGPNAILAPAGVPGGTVNNTTRRPQFRDFGSVSAEVGQFDTNRIELDYNREILPKTLAFRVVAAFQDTEGFAHDDKRTRAVMPMLTYRSPAGAELLLQASFVDWRAQNYLGVPIDPSSGTANEAKLLSGISRKLNTADDDFRRERRPEFRLLFTAPINSALSIRVAARHTDFDADFEQSPPGGATGGGYDPLTGYYVGGVTFSSTAPYASTPTTQSRTMARGGTWQTNHRIYTNLQNDYALQWKNDWIGTSTLIGGAYNYFFQASRDIATSKAAINYDAPAAANYVLGALSNRQNTINYDQQVYLNEMLSFFKERLILTGGYSYTNYDLAVDDLRTTAKYRVSVHKDLHAYGAVLKPFAGVSFYYGHSENAQPQAATTIAAGNPPLTEGSQNEFGVRYQSPDNRYSASLAHFDITQSNFAVPNPGNLVVPPPNPPLPFLLSDRKAKGWEVEARANITDSLAIIGNWTSFTNRDPNNVPFRGNAEQSWALSSHYQFPKTSSLQKLAVWVGVNHLSARPGDAASGVTAASTSTNIIPRQPSFYLPARTLVNLGFTYKYNANWRAQLSISNLLDEEYLAASLNRFLVFPGAPRDVRLKLTYRF
jgi:iron complex outermembrane receptor protein